MYDIGIILGIEDEESILLLVSLFAERLSSHFSGYPDEMSMHTALWKKT